MTEWLNFKDLKIFILENNLISYSVSWVVAVTFTLFIQSAVGDILLPSIYYLFLAIKTSLGYSTSPNVDSIFEKVNKINVANFLKEAVSFFCILIILYILIRDVLNHWIRVPAENNGNGLIQTKHSTFHDSSQTDSNTGAAASTNITQQPYYFKS